MKRLYSQREAALILGYKHYRSLDKLIADGKLECHKRPGTTGRKLFSERHLEDFIKTMGIDVN